MVRPSPPVPQLHSPLTGTSPCRQYLDRIRTTAGPFAVDEIDGPAVVEAMDSMKIL